MQNLLGYYSCDWMKGKLMILPVGYTANQFGILIKALINVLRDLGKGELPWLCKSRPHTKSLKVFIPSNER